MERDGEREMEREMERERSERETEREKREREPESVCVWEGGKRDSELIGSTCVASLWVRTERIMRCSLCGRCVTQAFRKEVGPHQVLPHTLDSQDAKLCETHDAFGVNMAWLVKLATPCAAPPCASRQYTGAGTQRTTHPVGT